MSLSNDKSDINVTSTSDAIILTTSFKNNYTMIKIYELCII